MRRHVYFCVSEAIYTPLGGVGSGKYVNKKEKEKKKQVTIHIGDGSDSEGGIPER